jgi:hypothetical protein
MANYPVKGLAYNHRAEGDLSFKVEGRREVVLYKDQPINIYEPSCACVLPNGITLIVGHESTIVIDTEGVAYEIPTR